MSIIRVFPRRTSYTPTDDMAFIGDPSLLRPEADEVHVSVTYTWDVAEGERLADAWSCYYPTVRIGGPAYGNISTSFIPGRYIKRGITFTTRGCNNRCSYCIVPAREGKLKEILNFKSGNIIQDNNLLQASSEHIERVFEMLRGQSAVEFRGGLDPRLITPEIAEGIRSTKPKRVYLAADTNDRLYHLGRAITLLGLQRHQVSVYTLIGHGDTSSITRAYDRLVDVWNAGGLPFAQLFQPADRWIEYSREWKKLARDFSRPALTMAKMTGAARV